MKERGQTLIFTERERKLFDQQHIFHLSLFRNNISPRGQTPGPRRSKYFSTAFATYISSLCIRKPFSRRAPGPKRDRVASESDALPPSPPDTSGLGRPCTHVANAARSISAMGASSGSLPRNVYNARLSRGAFFAGVSVNSLHFRRHVKCRGAIDSPDGYWRETPSGRGDVTTRSNRSYCFIGQKRKRWRDRLRDDERRENDVIYNIARHASCMCPGTCDYFTPRAPYTLHNISPPTRNISKASTRPWDSNRQTGFVRPFIRSVYSFSRRREPLTFQQTRFNVRSVFFPDEFSVANDLFVHAPKEHLDQLTKSLFVYERTNFLVETLYMIYNIII